MSTHKAPFVLAASNDEHVRADATVRFHEPPQLRQLCFVFVCFQFMSIVGIYDVGQHVVEA